MRWIRRQASDVQTKHTFAIKQEKRSGAGATDVVASTFPPSLLARPFESAAVQVTDYLFSSFLRLQLPCTY